MKETNQKVTKLSNEYTKQSDQNKKIKHLEQQVVRRRMKVFVPLLALPIIFISFTAFAQHQQNQELADELASTEQTLKDATAKEEQLLKQIERLNDDNYIARMARSEFYLSEDGEIIFNLLEDEE